MMPTQAQLDANMIQNVKHGNGTKVRDLLQQGANVNAKVSKDCTALNWASKNGQLEVVQALLNHKSVNVNVKDYHCEYDFDYHYAYSHSCSSTPLIFASENGHVEVVRALLNHDEVDVNSKNRSGKTALIVASYNARLQVVRDLLNHKGTEVNATDDSGCTALISASAYGHVAVVQALLHHEEVDVNAMSKYYGTALMAASENGHLAVVRALLNHKGVDVNIRDNSGIFYGRTALDRARSKRKYDVVRFLETHKERDNGNNPQATERNQDYQDNDRSGRVSDEKFGQNLAKQANQTKLDECLRKLDLISSDIQEVKVGVNDTKELLQQQQTMLQNLTKGLNRSLAALALLSSHQFKKCPNLVWLTPISVDKKDRNTPGKWIRNVALQKFRVVFICAHSHEPGHEPFEIEVPRSWIVKIAPWLKLCLQVLKTIANSQGLPFPIPNLPITQQYNLMQTFLDSLIDDASTAIVQHCEALLEYGTISINTYGRMQTLSGDAFKFIAEKVEENRNWKPPHMVPVVSHRGTPIWVKGIYEAHYEL